MDTIKKIAAALKDSGKVKQNVLPFLLAQVMFESGDFNSYLSRTHNNFSGISFAGQKAGNPTQGEPMPDAPGGYYARYASAEDWAKDYLRILSFGTKPIEATTPEEFVTRLKANGYFTADAGEYLNGLKYKLSNYNLNSVVNSVFSNNLLASFAIFIFLSSLFLLLS